MLRTEFPQFTKLPVEIRELIWKACLPGPRVLNIYQKRMPLSRKQWIKQQGPNYNPKAPEHCYDEDHNESQLFRHPDLEDSLLTETYCSNLGADAAIIPTLRLVCQESQEIVLSSYIPAFRTLASLKCIYFDLERDILYLRPEAYMIDQEIKFGSFFCELEGLDERSFRLEVKNLALRVTKDLADVRSPDEDDHYDNAVAACMSQFEGLERFIVVMAHDSEPTSKTAELALIDCVDVQRALKAEAKLDSDPAPTSVLDIIDHDWAVLDMDEVEKCRDETYEDGLSGFWEIPEIEYKIAVDVATASRIQKLQNRLQHQDRKR